MRSNQSVSIVDALWCLGISTYASWLSILQDDLFKVLLIGEFTIGFIPFMPNTDTWFHLDLYAQRISIIWFQSIRGITMDHQSIFWSFSTKWVASAGFHVFITSLSDTFLHPYETYSTHQTPETIQHIVLHHPSSFTNLPLKSQYHPLFLALPLGSHF
jgi:hypothetical protein